MDAKVPNPAPCQIQNPIMGMDWQVVDRNGNILGHFKKRTCADATAAAFEEAYVRFSSIAR